MKTKIELSWVDWIYHIGNAKMMKIKISDRLFLRLLFLKPYILLLMNFIIVLSVEVDIFLSIFNTKIKMFIQKLIIYRCTKRTREYIQH